MSRGVQKKLIGAGLPHSTTHNPLSVQMSTKYKLGMSNFCAQHDIVAELKHCHIVTCVRVNAICTTLQLTLVTHVSSHLLRVRLGVTKGTYIAIITHNILIIIVVLCNADHTCACTCAGYRTCLQIKKCCKCKSTRMYPCNSLPNPLNVFLTMPQCHIGANKCSIRTLQKP